MSIDPPQDELLLGFIDESQVALRELPPLLAGHVAAGKESDAIHRVFRAVHSIKGNAGFFGLTAIKQFAHALENTLDDVRNDKLTLDDLLCRAMIEGFDLLDDLLHQVESGDHHGELQPPQLALLERIREITHAETGLGEEQRIAQELADLAAEMASAGFPESLGWARRIQELTGTQVAEGEGFETGQGAVHLSPEEALKETFEVEGNDITAVVHAIATTFQEAESGAWPSERSERAVGQLADFVAACGPAPAASQAAAQQAANDFKTLYESPIGIDGGLISVVWDQVAAALAGLLPEPPTVEAAVVETALPTGEVEASVPQPKKSRSVRVNEESIDRFLDDVSSLFITCERLKDVQYRMALAQRGDELVEELRQINASFSAQAGDLQKSVVALRRVPIRALFSKFPRMARSLAGGLGKSLNVHLEGEEVEVDKSLIEDLDAPLTHMIRNVADHALETPAEREKRGADPTGNLWLRAENTRTHVLITIRDDGRGIDPQRLKKKVVEKGVMTQAQADLLSDQELVELIFHPGFSTAEQVTDISGRGVGMDVVRTTIREMEGEVKVRSTVGVGTEFFIEIPIRQAVLVIDGLLVSHGQDRFVLPFSHIREVLEIDPAEVNPCQGRPMVPFRGDWVSLVYLEDMLGLGASEEHPPGALRPAVLVTSKNGEACLVVDKILGKRKVVVNDMQAILSETTRISGVAQLGGGKLALVLSVPDMIQTMVREASLGINSAKNESGRARVLRSLA